MPRILIVEDDELVRRTFQRWLRSVPAADVLYAEDGEQALSCLREGVFDLIVSDVDMPRMNGLQLLKCITVEYPEMLAKFVFFTSSLNGPLTMAGVKIPVFDKAEFRAIRTIIAQDLKPAV